MADGKYNVNRVKNDNSNDDKRERLGISQRRQGELKKILEQSLREIRPANSKSKALLKKLCKSIENECESVPILLKPGYRSTDEIEVEIAQSKQRLKDLHSNNKKLRLDLKNAQENLFRAETDVKNLHPILEPAQTFLSIPRLPPSKEIN